MRSQVPLIRNVALLIIIAMAPRGAAAAGSDACTVWGSEPDDSVHWVCRDCVWMDCHVTCYQFNCSFEGSMYGDDSPECWYDNKNCPRQV
jgi:hypothetical protein